MINKHSKDSFKVAWIAFVGIWGALLSAILGAICCATIIGIPFGLKYFKFIKLIFMPSNVAVATRTRRSHLAVNLFWAIFGGIFARYLSALVEAVFSLFKISRPLANQLHNVRDYLISPFDSELVEAGKYSSTQDTRYDYSLLQRKILQNPNLLIMDEKKGRVVTIKKHLKQYDNEVTSITKATGTTIFLAVAVMFFGFASMLASAPIGIPIVAITFIISVVANDFQNAHLLKFYDKNMKKLLKLYNEDAPLDQTRSRLKLSYVFVHLAEERAKHKRNIIKSSAAQVPPTKPKRN